MPSRIHVGRHGGRHTAAAAATAVLLLAGCGEPATAPPSTSSSDQPIAGTFEEAALVALGELFRIYGTDAAPTPLEVSGEIDTHDGHEVWRLDGTYEVTVDNQRRHHRWTLWIGPTDDSPLTVLDADGPE
jgi:hypothetical protein